MAKECWENTGINTEHGVESELKCWAQSKSFSTGGLSYL